MNAEIIGTQAGTVWNALNENGKLSLKELKKVTKLKVNEIHAALGWLAKEDKVNFNDVEGDVEVSLK